MEMTERERAAWSIAQNFAKKTNPVGKVLAAGNATVPVQQYTQLQVFGGCAWQSDNGESAEVTVSVGAIGNVSGWAMAQVPGFTQALSIEYGVGASAVQVLCDIRMGAIALPPCSYVKLGLAYGPGYTGAPITTTLPLTLPMSIVQGSVSGADNPTYTIGAMADGSYVLPAQAVDVELLNPGTLTIGLQNIKQLSDASPAVVQPPWSPVEIPGTAKGQTFTWANSAATPGSLGICVFGLQL